ncbi:MAG: hypothetical protein HZB16_23630 [Armatimonadetes bacterium]|nr:hypothetical protein [Armatimonadota bacterium]
MFKLAWRIAVPRYETDAAFDRLLALFHANLPILDEVCFFETVTHQLYVEPAILERRAAILADRITACRELGIPSVGINVLTSIGHIDEAWDTNPPLPFQPMIGHDGGVAKGSGCPNDPALRQYVDWKYRLFAGAKPDFIWVDDDFRIHHHTVPFPCFCDRCLGLLSAETGVRWTREALVNALDQPEAGATRRAWVERNVRSLEDLLTHIGRSVRAVDPGIELGLMTAGPGWTTYSGVQIGRWLRALGATKLRPGGGFYGDAARLGIIDKALDCGRQLEDLPEAVTDTQYEMENFPYQRLAKAGATLAHETLLALANGHTGIAYNALGMSDLGFEDEEHLLAAIHAGRVGWDELANVARGTHAAGLWPAWSRDLAWKRELEPGETWWHPSAWHSSMVPTALAEIGLPLAAQAPGDGTILVGRMVEALDDDELRALLSGGLLCDGVALGALEARGLGHLTGVRTAGSYTNGLAERLTDDTLNGSFAGELRDARIEFWGDSRGQAVALEPLDDGARVLARLEDYFGRPGEACVSAYENEYGGRVAVMGYAPWMFLRSVSKRWQLLSLADWLTRDRLAVRIDEPVSVTPWVRLDAERRRGFVVLLNHGLDVLESVTVRVRLADGETAHRVGPMAAWSTAVVVV